MRTLICLAITSIACLEAAIFNGPYSNSNAEKAANNINSLAASGSLYTDADLNFVVSTLSGQSSATINNALNQMHPAPYSALSEIQTQVDAQETTIFHHRPYQQCTGISPWDLWVEPFGNWFNEKTHGQQIGFTSRTRGVAFGVDTQLLQNWLFGFGAVYDNTNFNWHVYGGHGIAKSWKGAIYTDYQSKRFYIGAVLLGGYDHYDTSRKIKFTTIDRRAHANHHALDLAGQLSTALIFGPNWFTVSPYANLDYFYLQQSKFTEFSAGGLNLKVRKNSSSTFRSEVGLSLQVRNDEDKTLCISPILALSWIMECPIHRPSYRSNFKGEPIAFKAEGWDRDLQLLSPSLGFVATYKQFSLSAQYIAEYAPSKHLPFFGQKGNVRLDWSW